MTSSVSSTFVDALAVRADSAGWSRLIRVASTLFVAALTAAAAQISVPLPFTDVPFTFQPTVVLLGGLALGSRLGLASQVLYLAAGIAGLPVFAASPALAPGLLRLLGPTGGYLMSYPFAACLVGRLAERGFDRRYFTAVAAMLVGLAVIYGCGAVWLGLFARTPAPASIGIERAFMTGVVPFIVPDVLKLLAAAAVLPTVWRLSDLRRSHF